VPAYVSFTEGVHVLLEDFQLDVNSRDAYGATALHVAVWQGQLELVIRLLSKGADRLIPDSNGRTALHYAILRGHTAMAGLLCVPPTELNAAAAVELRKKVRVGGRLI
jgi:ankyrin repeat protein